MWVMPTNDDMWVMPTNDDMLPMQCRLENMHRSHREHILWVEDDKSVLPRRVSDLDTLALEICRTFWVEYAPV